MVTAEFRHIDTSTLKTPKPWSKYEEGRTNFEHKEHTRPVYNLRGREHEFHPDTSGFAVYHHPAKERLFTDDAAIKEGYYKEVEALLREKLPGIKKVFVFDHQIRRQEYEQAKRPVKSVHVDQTPKAAEAFLGRFLPADEAEELAKTRFQVMNVWRPIQHPASDLPLAVVDWRSTSPEDFVPVDIWKFKRADSAEVDDGAKGAVQDAQDHDSLENYDLISESMGVLPREEHKFYYMKDMTPDEVLLLKCYDSRGEGTPNGKKGVALRTPHSAFADPEAPEGAPGRQSIEVRCLVFYE